MDPSSGQHQQMSSQSLENMLGCTKSQQEIRRPKPQPAEQALKCPRCNSTNTKFCYYNNYNLSQPRHFCKSCRRYWTKGGTLRNVPVGGGCRKNNKRSSSSKRTPQDPTFTTHNNPNPLTGLNPLLSYDSNDLNLAFASLQKQSCGQIGFDGHDLSMMGNPTNTNHGFLDALRSGFLGTHNNMQNLYYGYGNGEIMGEVENGNNASGLGDSSGEMMLLLQPNDQEMSTVATTQAVTVTTMKQEFCNDKKEQSENRVLWSFPTWQLNINGDSNMGELDSAGRASWNSLTSSWQGLLSSPLM